MALLVNNTIFLYLIFASITISKFAVFVRLVIVFDGLLFMAKEGSLKVLTLFFSILKWHSYNICTAFLIAS